MVGSGTTIRLRYKYDKNPDYFPQIPHFARTHGVHEARVSPYDQSFLGARIGAHQDRYPDAAAFIFADWWSSGRIERILFR